ncbi:MAG: helix-turn-helix domain-containing protein [Eubacteriaceae bacterium]|nr:helix-turn-helix domain-containing protein [Eubacteriaceae bacterium]
MNSILKKYIELAEFIADSAGDTFETIVFDTTDESLPSVGHFNPLRGTENPTREILKEALKSRTIQKNGKTLNRAVASEHKKIIKTSIFLIRDEEDTTVGALCINVNCHVYFELEKFFSGIMKFNTSDMEKDECHIFDEEKKKEAPTLDTIDRMIAEFEVEPGRMSADERIEIICDMFDEGVFEIKGSVAKTAKALGVSEKTIYRYLSEIRKARG